jgi:uncharacterized membrane protein HdeD (DUF308 family)
MIINKLLSAVTGVAKNSGDIAKSAASVVKDHKGKVSSKRVFSVFGGGTIISYGLTFIKQGIEAEYDKALYVGLALVFVGVAAGYLAAFNIKEINKTTN